jgi:hypothetical protein
MDAKLDCSCRLDLEANETGGLTPNIAYIQPLRNAFFLGAGPSSINTVTGAVTNMVGATAQNFTLGISGTYNGVVTRTETLSFTVSLAELKQWNENSRSAQFCTPSGRTDLQEGLDLKSWLDEALSPATTGELKTGIHPAPGTAKSVAKVSPSPQPPATRAALKPEAVPVPEFPLTPEGKARHDLQLANALTVLGVPYNLGQFNSPADNDKSFCTAIYSKEGPKVRVMSYKPLAFQTGAPDKNPTLEMQAASAAQNAYSAANQAAVSPILREGIKREANDAAQAAAGRPRCWPRWRRRWSQSFSATCGRRRGRRKSRAGWWMARLSMWREKTMLNRREFTLSVLAVCVVGPAAAEDVAAVAKHPWFPGRDYRLLKEAWAITDGKDEAGMYEALTQRFGPFPIMFISIREAEVGIFGVWHYPPDFDRRGYPRRGYLDCDVRILGERHADCGIRRPWRSLRETGVYCPKAPAYEDWSASNPSREGMSYYKPMLIS